MVSSLLRAIVACIALHLAANAAAQPRDGSAVAAQLTLASAIEMALARNPDLIASRYELTAARGRITQAGLRINPQLDVELENFATQPVMLTEITSKTSTR